VPTVTLTLFAWCSSFSVSHRAGCFFSTSTVCWLLFVIFARQFLKQPVGGALDIVVLFGTGTLFGGDEGAAM
jgi:hypothetical protein